MESLNSSPESFDVPIVTASEVAEFIYCPHAWYLKQHGAPVTEKARPLREEGRQWQDQKDAIIPAALHTQQQAQRKSDQAKIILWIFLIVLGIVGLYLSFFSPR